MAVQEPEVNGMTDSLKDLSVTGMLNRAIEEALANPIPIEEQAVVDPTIDQNFQALEPAQSGILNRAIEETFGTTPNEEQPIPDPTIDPNFQVLLPADSLLKSQIKIINQPETDKFRHESDKLVAMPIKGQKMKGANWPEIEITGNPEGPAEIWIQLVEHKDDAERNPRPSPNGLFLKKDKKSKGFNPPPGIEIISDGDGIIPGTEADGIIKLRIPNLADVGWRICFNEKLPLTLFRTKACDVWNYLEKKNIVNQNTPDKLPRLSYVKIPQNAKEAKDRKNEIDTTRARICFQVFLQSVELYSNNSSEQPQPYIWAPNPVCSHVIVDRRAHQELYIDASAPVIATDEGIDHCVILCSKIEDSDLNNLRLIFTFQNEHGQDIIVENPIPKRNPPSALVHKQVAFKFGKIHDFDMPSYRQLVKKLDIDTHAHAFLQLSKFHEDPNEYPEVSNPIEVIIFPDGYEKRKGKCIGKSFENSGVPCKYFSPEKSSPTTSSKSTPGATENLPNTDRVLNDVVEMEIKSEPSCASNILQNPIIPLAAVSKSTNTSKLPEFRFGLHKIASPNKIDTKRPHPGPSGLTEEDCKPPLVKEKN